MSVWSLLLVGCVLFRVYTFRVGVLLQAWEVFALRALVRHRRFPEFGERILIMQPRCVLFCAVLVFLSGCRDAAVDDVRDDARGVIDRARDGAEAVAGLSAEEVHEIMVAHAVRAAESAAEELRELSAIEYITLVVLEADLADVDELLNELGRDRWQCYHVSDGLDGKTFYLQRTASNAIPRLMRLSRLSRFVF